MRSLTFCGKFNFEQLLLEAFFHIISIFGSVQAVWPIFLAMKASISLSSEAQKAHLKFFNVARRAQQNF